MIDGSESGTAAYPIWVQEGIAEYKGNEKTILEYSNLRVVPFSQLVEGEQYQNSHPKWS
jgi:hypothetical protein